MTLENLEILLFGCKSGDRASQKRLYEQFFGLGMSIATRYAAHREEAEEICQDGFVKVFSRIGDCRGVESFVGWMRRIFVCAAIDHYRKHHLYRRNTDRLDAVPEIPIQNEALSSLSIAEKLALVRQLPPIMRLTFNLYAVEGYTTSEIAEQLQIAEGTVRTHLASARARLQKMILETEKNSHPTHG